MVVLFGLYYRAGNLLLMVASLAGWWLIALLKPATGLAMVAFAIPFFWYPKQYGSLKFPIAETILLLVFAAVLVRRAVSAFRPGLAQRLRFIDVPGAVDPQSNGEIEGPLASMPSVTLVKGEQASSSIATVSGAIDSRTTKPLPISDYVTEEESRPTQVETGEELRPATWPVRPEIVFTRPALDGRGYATAVDGGRWTVDDTKTMDNGQLTIQSPKIQTRAVSRSLWARFFDWNAEDAFGAPAVAMLLLGALSLLTLANPDFAADSGRAYRWVIIEPVLFYFLLTDVIKGRRGLLRVLDFFMLAAVVVATYGLWQFVRDSGTLDVEGVSRVVSVYEHPNNLALYLGRAAPLAACIALFLPWGWRKALFGLATLPLAAALLLTFSRGAWIGVAVAMLVAASVGLRWKWGWVKATVPRSFKFWLAGVGVGIVLVGLIGLVVFPKLPERIFNPGSGVLRLTIWNAALHMVGDHPIVGIGPDQFLNQYQSGYQYPIGYGPCKVTDKGVESTSDNDTQTSTTQSVNNECFTAHPHNIFLDYWLTLGIMGLIVLVWLLWRYYRESINLAKWAASKVGADPLARALAVGLVAVMTDFLVHGLVDNSYFLMDLALIFWMSCGMVQLLRKRLGIIS